MKSIIDLQNIKAAVKKLALEAGIKFAENAMIEEHILFMRNNITEKSGIIQLIQQKDTAIDGIRNIDGARLVSGEAFICTGIAFASAFGTKNPTSEMDITKMNFSGIKHGGQ